MTFTNPDLEGLEQDYRDACKEIKKLKKQNEQIVKELIAVKQKPEGTLSTIHARVKGYTEWEHYESPTKAAKELGFKEHDVIEAANKEKTLGDTDFRWTEACKHCFRNNLY